MYVFSPRNNFAGFEHFTSYPSKDSFRKMLLFGFSTIEYCEKESDELWKDVADHLAWRHLR